MRLAEFQEKAERYHRRALLAIAPMLGVLAGFFCYAPFARQFEAFLDARFSPLVVAALITLPLALPFLLGFWLVLHLGRRIEKEHGVPCPHCGKALASARLLVVASRNCPHCGGRVIDEA